mmetsp:Transcript_53198/g.126549  ORF Transcript_53198/g.126549 Transcript_53198/m.126549 type:complete len:229 (+) Transcript_53198:376-1062(+)
MSSMSSCISSLSSSTFSGVISLFICLRAFIATLWAPTCSLLNAAFSSAFFCVTMFCSMLSTLSIWASIIFFRLRHAIARLLFFAFLNLTASWISALTLSSRNSVRFTSSCSWWLSAWSASCAELGPPLPTAAAGFAFPNSFISDKSPRNSLMPQGPVSCTSLDEKRPPAQAAKPPQMCFPRSQEHLPGKVPEQPALSNSPFASATTRAPATATESESSREYRAGATRG